PLMVTWNVGREMLGKFLTSTCLGLALGGCSSAEDEDQFTYDGADMQALVVGTWTGDFRLGQADASSLTLELDSINDPESRELACGNRTFSTPGETFRPTCVSGSTLLLSGVLEVADGSLPTTELRGEFSIWSLNLDGGNLSLRSSDDGVSLSADRDESGAWTTCRVQVSGSAIGCSLKERE
ncbi:MAG TPA: hypothetical protein VGK73_25825, partial [Polyangiaceae bacterium]